MSRGFGGREDTLQKQGDQGLQQDTRGKFVRGFRSESEAAGCILTCPTPTNKTKQTRNRTFVSLSLFHSPVSLFLCVSLRFTLPHANSSSQREKHKHTRINQQPYKKTTKNIKAKTQQNRTTQNPKTTFYNNAQQHNRKNKTTHNNETANRTTNRAPRDQNIKKQAASRHHSLKTSRLTHLAVRKLENL